MLFKINPINPQSRLIQKAVDILTKGGIVVYPTDTYYGIGCDILNKKAIERIYQLKQLPAGTAGTGCFIQTGAGEYRSPQTASQNPGEAV